MRAERFLLLFLAVCFAGVFFPNNAFSLELYDSFSDTYINKEKWIYREWIREIDTGSQKLLLEQASPNPIVISSYPYFDSNILEFINPSTVTSFQADVTLLEASITNSAIARARLYGLFYNDGTPGGGVIGDILAQVYIQRGTNGQLIAKAEVLRLPDPQGTTWELLGVETFSVSVEIGTPYRLYLAYNNAMNQFTFRVGDEEKTIGPEGLPPKISDAKVSRRALATLVLLNNATSSGYVSATFDNVYKNGVLYDDFSSPILDETNWIDCEFVREISEGKFRSKARSGPRYTSYVSSSTQFVNPERINVISTKVTPLAYQNEEGASPLAHIYGRYYNDGSPGGGFIGDVGATIGIGGSNPIPKAVWVVYRLTDYMGDLDLKETLAQGEFTLPITFENTYTLSLGWDGSRFRFKFDGEEAEYVPTTNINPPRHPWRGIGSGVFSNAGGKKATIEALFDDVMINSIVVTPQFVDFGAVEIGGYFDQTVNVSNNGDGDVTFSSFTLPSSPFGIPFNNCEDHPLHPGESCYIVVRFSPTTQDQFSSKFSASSDYTNEPTLTVNLYGSGGIPSHQVLPVDTPANGQVSNSSEVSWYTIQVTGSQPLFVYLDKTSGWDAGIAIYRGAIKNPLELSESLKDQMLMVEAPEEGTYYIEVWSASPNRGLPGGYSLTARRSLDTLTLGQKLEGQQIGGDWGKKWYQLKVDATSAGRALYIQQEKSTTGETCLRLRHSTVPGDQPDSSTCGVETLTVGVASAQEGTYYIEVESKTIQTLHYSLMAFTSGISPELALCSAPLVMSLNKGDLIWYKLNVPQTENLFVMVKKKEKTWNSTVTIKSGNQTVAMVTESGDSILQLKNPQAGEYTVEIYASADGEADIRACTNLPILYMDQLFVGTIYRNDGYDWLQMDVPEGTEALEFTVETVGNVSNLDVWRSDFDSSEHWYGQQSFNPPLRLVIQNVQPGRHYLRVWDHGLLQGSQVRDYSIRVQELQAPIVIDNSYVRAQIDPNRGCVTSLIFKKGSNTELIAPQWGSYIIDFGTDPRLGNRLRSGWYVKSIDQQPNYWKFSFKHPSGFANEMVLSWAEDKIEIRCDIIAPDSLETFSVLRIGGGWESGRDKWAFPETDGVKTGTFSYPGAHTALYPADHSWGTPAEGWIALWDDQVNEVYGFTFSGGIKAKICNGAGADQHFLFPAGAARITFHVVKPKLATPYQTIRNLASSPYLSLTKEVDKLFTGSGNELNYSLFYGNTGTCDATNVVIEDNLPTNLEMVEGSISNGGTYNPTTRRITWNIASLPVEEEAQIVTFKANIKPGTAEGTKIVNTAGIRSTEQPTPYTSSVATTIAAAPSIVSISPDKGGNAGTVTVTITGNNLDPNAEVKLTKIGETDIVGNMSTGSSDGTHLTANLDITEKTVGIWSLVVTNPGGQSTTLPNAFTIESGGEAKLWVEIIGRNQIRMGREQTFMITYGNRGNMNAIGVPLWIGGIPKGATVKLNFDVLPPRPLPETSLDYSQVPTSIEAGNQIIIPLLLPMIPSGFTGTLSFTISVPSSEKFQIRAWINPPWFGSPPTEDTIECIMSIIQAAFKSSIPFKHCVDYFFDDLRKLLTGGLSNLPVNLSWSVADLFFSCGSESACMICGGSGTTLTPACVVCAAGKIYQAGKDIYDAYQNGKACANTGRIIMEGILDISSVTSLDPNGKASPAGYDAESISSAQQKRFTAQDRPVPYMVYFENLETATGAVQDMSITDHLDPNLDWFTFAFESIQIGTRRISTPLGSKDFSADIDLRPEMNAIVQIRCTFDSQTGIAQWYFKGTDPYTGLLADFLPPNTQNIDPGGRGWVSYSVKPKPNIPTGTVIKNKAIIDFEVGVPPAPVDTPEVFNTIDSVPPVSSVSPLSATQGIQGFAVSWSGSDDAGGSGIKNYDIYVSDNGGPYTLWLTTSETSAIFNGQFNHQYSFYSRARDNVGNAEDPPAMADAVTTVSFSITPREGTMGTEITIAGHNFGSSKGKVMVGTLALNISSWGNEQIQGVLGKPMLPATYNVIIRPTTKGASPITVPNGFTVKAPEIYSIGQTEGSAYDRVTVRGKFFGTKKGTVYLEHDEGGSLIKKGCTVLSWTMDRVTGDSEIVFVVPPVMPVAYDVVVDPYGGLPDAEGEHGFEVKAPEIGSVEPVSNSVGDAVTIKGKFFGSKKGRVYLGYMSKGKYTKKSCSVSGWTAGLVTEEDEVVFVVPKLNPGVYDVIVINSVGSDTLAGGFTVE